MNFSISKEDIVKALNFTLGVVEKRQTLPILSNVLINVDESSLKLTATDLESEVSTTCVISNFKSGGLTTAPARKLSDLCRLLPDASEIHFYLDGADLKIEAGAGKYNLTTLPSEDFPTFEIEDSLSEINISPTGIKALIGNTTFAMGNDSWRDYLSGLNLIADDKTITAVATDGSRLAVANALLNEAVPNSISGIVPKKSINEIGKLVSDASENIIIKLGPSSISVDVGGTKFVSKLIEGKFPDHEQVIPFGESSMLKIDRKEFSDSLSRVSVLSGGDHKGVRFITEKNTINISANNPEKERGEESLTCSYDGENIDIAFNVNTFKKFYPPIPEEIFFGSLGYYR